MLSAFIASSLVLGAFAQYAQLNTYKDPACSIDFIVLNARGLHVHRDYFMGYNYIPISSLRVYPFTGTGSSLGTPLRQRTNMGWSSTARSTVQALCFSLWLTSLLVRTLVRVTRVTSRWLVTTQQFLTAALKPAHTSARIPRRTLALRRQESPMKFYHSTRACTMPCMHNTWRSPAATALNS